MSNAILSLLGWSFLPQFVAGNLQGFWYSLTIRAGEPKPQPGTHVYARHRRRIFIGVVLTYLLYTIYEADWNIRQASDFYVDLGVPYDVEDKALQSRFRRLTLLHHPDKLASEASAGARTLSEAYYVQLKLARETLSDPARRFAYDRFGPSMLQWKDCVTLREFAMQGIRGIVPFYIGSLGFLWLYAWFGFVNSGSYWRYIAFAALFTIELHTITRPWFTAVTRIPTLLNPLIGNTLFSYMLGWSARRPYLPFQAIEFAHRAIITLFIALAQLGPIFTAMLQESTTGARMDTRNEAGSLPDTEDEIRARLQRLETLLNVASSEAERMLLLETVPFRKDPAGGLHSNSGSGSGTDAGGSDGGGAARERSGRGGGTEGVSLVGTELLKRNLKEWFVTNALRKNAAVQSAMWSSVARRRGQQQQGQQEQQEGRLDQ